MNDTCVGPSLNLRLPASLISIPILGGLVRTLDLLLMMLAGLLIIKIQAALNLDPAAGPLYLATIASSIGAALVLARDGPYKVSALISIKTQLRLLLGPLIMGGICGLVCLGILLKGGLFWPAAWVLTSLLLLGTSRLFLCPTVRRWSSAGRLARKVAVVGVNEFSHEFIRRLSLEPNAFQVVGVFDDRLTRVPKIHSGISVCGTTADLLVRTREDMVDVIVVALPLRATERIAQVVGGLSSTVADICLTADIASFRFTREQFEGVGGNPVVSVSRRPLKDWDVVQKAVLDYAIAALAFVMLSPILLVAALLIRLESPGPILFRQPRMGFNNKPFVCYKFRTMYHGMTDLLSDKQATRGDPRVTRVGRYLRKLSVDELPQLFNVFSGSMSLVGPRPHAQNSKAADRLFGDIVRQYAARHRMKPGITGWAQVNGWRGETKTVNDIEQRVACDMFYIENWSIWLDLKIMAMTLLREVFSRRAF